MHALANTLLQWLTPTDLSGLFFSFLFQDLKTMPAPCQWAQQPVQQSGRLCCVLVPQLSRVQTCLHSQHARSSQYITAILNMLMGILSKNVVWFAQLERNLLTIWQVTLSEHFCLNLGIRPPHSQTRRLTKQNKNKNKNKTKQKQKKDQSSKAGYWNLPWKYRGNSKKWSKKKQEKPTVFFNCYIIGKCFSFCFPLHKTYYNSTSPQSTQFLGNQTNYFSCLNEEIVQNSWL